MVIKLGPLYIPSIRLLVGGGPTQVQVTITTVLGKTSKQFVLEFCGSHTWGLTTHCATDF